jgi:hypothetical protein
MPNSIMSNKAPEPVGAYPHASALAICSFFPALAAELWQRRRFPA